MIEAKHSNLKALTQQLQITVQPLSSVFGCSFYGVGSFLKTSVQLVIQPRESVIYNSIRLLLTQAAGSS